MTSVVASIKPALLVVPPASVEKLEVLVLPFSKLSQAVVPPETVETVPVQYAVGPAETTADSLRKSFVPAVELSLASETTRAPKLPLVVPRLKPVGETAKDVPLFAPEEISVCCVPLRPAMP